LTLLTNFRRHILDIIYYIRKITPVRIHRIIGSKIKKANILKILFSLPFGVIYSTYKKNYSRIIILKRKANPSTINVLDISALDAYQEIFLEQVYEKYNRMKEGDVILDIGANIGIFSIKAAKAVGESGKVIAIEPEPKNIKILNENLRNLKNILIIPKALGNSSGKTNFLIGIHSGSHKINTHIRKESTEKIISVPIEKIDNLIGELNIKKINFLKMDVEGWELEVLKGAEGSLDLIEFMVIASYHTKNERKLITDFLDHHHFKFLNDGEFTFAWNKKFS